MVGVPGRSKACNTCLKRKIKCDLAKPSCGNCIKSRRICGGYTRKTAYVFSDNVVLEQANLATDDGTVTYQGRWKGAAKTPECSQSVTERARRTKKPFRGINDAPSDSDNSSSRSASEPPSPLDVQRIPMMPSLWQQLHHVFVHAYMPREGMGLADNPEHVTGNWLLQLRGRPSTLPALQTSIAAFASAQIGREHNDANLVAQSMQLYLKSLEHLRNAIANPSTRLDDETLAACLALGIFELTENRMSKLIGTRAEKISVESRPHSGRPQAPTCTTAYSKHMAGAMMLLELRGPEANNTPLAHSLFLGLRRQIIVTTLIKHTDTFLSHEEWRERPWSVFPKNTLDKCLDCVFDLPILQRLADEMLLEKDSTRIQSQCDTLLEKCHASLEKLDNWYAHFKELISGPPYWSVFCSLDSQQDDTVLGKPFPVSYFFPTFSTSYLLMMYWTGTMICHWLFFVVYRTLTSLAEESRLSASPEATADVLRARRQVHKDGWVGMTRNLCSMTEYLLSDGKGKISVTVALAVLEGAMEMFRDGTEDWVREKAWVTEMIALTVSRMTASSMVMM